VAGAVPCGDERYRVVTKESAGEGTEGVVYVARDTVTMALVAVKRVRLGSAREGVNPSALREVKILREMDHPRIVRLLDAYFRSGTLKLVLEYLPGTLEKVIKDTSRPLGLPEIKTYLRMLLEGLAHCHSRWVLHRDVKPDNLLIGPDGGLRLADFGLSRIFGSPNPRYTAQVATVWYRAPELLLGASRYGPAVDIWSAGCIFAEMMLRRVFLASTTFTDLDQLSCIIRVFGTIDEASWPGVSTLLNGATFSEGHPVPLASIFPAATEEALDLLKRMMAYSPAARITAAEALAHPFFTKGAKPAPIESLPKPTIPTLSE
jgi:cyclin-dependent kinase 7